MKTIDAYNKYKTQSVMTATPAELTLMLYNGCIKFINKSIKACEEKDMQLTHNMVMRAQDIISELRSTLNPEIEISNEMDKMYEYAQYALLEGNINKDITWLESALSIMKDFREAWQGVMKSVNKEVSSVAL